MAYEVVLSRAAHKVVRALPDATKRRVLRALKDLEADPRPPGVIALQGHEGLLRQRVGDYCIIYPMNDNALKVLIAEIGHRREVYRGL